MVRYSLDDVHDDMVLGESLFSPNGDLLLSAGYRVTLQYRTRLKELSFQTILIDVEGTEGIIPELLISEHLQREMTIALNKSVQELQNIFTYKKITKKTLNEMIVSNKNELDRLIVNAGVSHALEKMINEILDQSTVVLNLSVLDKVNKELFAHTINVTIVSLCIARKFRLSYEEMKQLGMGAFNYDLGLAIVSKEILEKPDPLDDDDKKHLQQHAVFGHLMLSQNVSIPPTSAAVALQHHEYQDGSGYPRGIKGENRPPVKDLSHTNLIHRFSEIVTVADVYNMLSEGRPHYSEKRALPEVLKTLIGMSGKKLNREVVKALLSMVPLYPVGTRIRVVNAPVGELMGYCGVVAKDNPANLEEPQIILYETRHRQKIKPILVDLAKHKGFALELA